MKKLVVPKFATEREEADWWYANRRVLESNFLEAMRNGTVGRGIVERLAREGKLSKAPKKSSRA
jgi:hypothetical protein